MSISPMLDIGLHVVPLLLDTFCFEELVWLETTNGVEAAVKSVSGHFKAEDSGLEKDINGYATFC